MANKVQGYLSDIARMSEMKSSPVKYAKDIEEKRDKIDRAQRWLKNFDISEKDHKKHLVMYETLHRKLIKEIRPSDNRDDLKKTLATFYAERSILTRKSRAGKLSFFERRTLKKYNVISANVSEMSQRIYEASKQADRNRYFTRIESVIKRL
jgi:hypothetical protein